MKKINNISQYPLSNLEINPIFEQMQQSQAMLDKLPKPNPIFEQIKQCQAMLDKLPKSNPIFEQMKQCQAMLNKLPKSNPILEQMQQSQAMLNKLPKPNPIFEQMRQSQTMLDKLLKPNSIFEQMHRSQAFFNKIQQSTQLYEQLHKLDIISSFTSKLKDTEYNDDNLINQIEETKPMVDILKNLPKEFQESLIEEIKLYIDEQVDIKISAKLKEKNSEINSYNTADPNVSIIFNDAINAIATAFESLCGFYAICPDSMKNDVYLICFLLLMSLFAIPTIYFLCNYYKQK